MTPPLFWDQFWPNLLATLIGAFFGVVLGLWVDRRKQQAVRRSEEASLLRSLARSVTVNLDIIAQLKPMLALGGKQIPTMELDQASVDAILPRLDRVSTDVEFAALVAAFQWSLHNSNRALQRLVDVPLAPVGDPTDQIAKQAFETRLANKDEAFTANHWRHRSRSSRNTHHSIL